MRIGIDFDNTIACYDDVFCDLAKQWRLVDRSFKGTKSQLRDAVWSLTDGDALWQRLQGKAYGEYMHNAKLFAGFKEFIAVCNANKAVEVFIVSHKTEYGHFDEKGINLRDAARQWLHAQNFFNNTGAAIPKENVFFETTRSEKIARIITLQCTHFIDDLIEVLDSPLFPKNVERLLFQPREGAEQSRGLTQYSNWAEIKNAIFRI